MFVSFLPIQVQPVVVVDVIIEPYVTFDVNVVAYEVCRLRLSHLAGSAQC